MHYNYRKKTSEKGCDVALNHFQNENPFNVLALLIAALPRISPELYRSWDKRSALSDAGHWDEKVYDLLTSFPELNDTDGLLRDGIRKETLVRLKEWCTENSGFSPILSLICGLDSVLNWNNILRSSYVAVGLKDGFEALNDNGEETGILILPRVPSLNDPLDRASTGPEPSDKTWAHKWEPGINEELANLYYVEKSQLKVNNKAYAVIHKVVTDWIVGSQIILAVSPVAKGAQLLEPSCYESEGSRRFSIAGLKDPEYIRRRIRAAYMKAAENGAGLLIFPEMLGDAPMFESAGNASEFFSQLQEEAENAEYSSPAVILPPTWWHENHNQLHVVDGNGEYICVQEKQNPFLYHDDKTNLDYLEDLRGTPPVVQVLHVPYVGRITFPICKDYLVAPYRGLLVRTLRSTLMLCPSYSKGKFSFHISAPTELEYGCYTLWVNTCSALPEEKAPPDYVGLISAPNHDFFYELEPHCNGQCGAVDDPCLFLVEIDRTGGAPRVAVREHICLVTEQLKKEERP